MLDERIKDFKKRLIEAGMKKDTAEKTTNLILKRMKKEKQKLSYYLDVIDMVKV